MGKDYDEDERDGRGMDECLPQRDVRRECGLGASSAETLRREERETPGPANERCGGDGGAFWILSLL